MILGKHLFVLLYGILLLPATNGINFKNVSMKSVTKMHTDLQADTHDYFNVDGKPRQSLPIAKHLVSFMKCLISPKVINTLEIHFVFKAADGKGNLTAKPPAYIRNLLKFAAAEAAKKAATSKIQSNDKNIEHDEHNNFFYERNIIVEPSIPAQKFSSTYKEKGEESQHVSKEQLTRMSFKRYY